jgi:hypothetical protein
MMRNYAARRRLLLTLDTTHSRDAFTAESAPQEGRRSPIFVFGSNLAGRHGRGSAAAALRHHGAVYGVGEGRTGSAYALPTKDAALKSLPLASVLAGIERFKTYASLHPGDTFEVTRVGCGLAGFRDCDLYPAFSDAPANCVLPYLWQIALQPELPPRVIVAGSRDFDNYALLESKLDHFLSNMDGKPVIVSGTAHGADRLGERYAAARGLEVLRFPAQWGRYGRAAGMLRNHRMAWAGSHLVAFWDGRSRGTQNMIETATDGRLSVRTVCFSRGASRAVVQSEAISV